MNKNSPKTKNYLYWNVFLPLGDAKNVVFS